MSFANFGIGLGAFAQGLNQGIQAGNQIGSLINQGRMRRAREEGMEEAKAARESAIDNLVQAGSASNASNTMTVPTYSVGEQQYADQSAARKAAEGRVGSLDEFFTSVAAPKIYERYMEIDPEKAEKWKAFYEDKQVKQGMKHWAGAVRRANMGDFEGFGQEIVKAYNTNGYLDDGIQVTKWDTLKDADGNAIGVNLTLKGADGKEYNQAVNGVQDAYKLGAYLLSPQQVFNTMQQRALAGQKEQAEREKEDRQFKRDVALVDRKAELEAQQQAQSDEAKTNRLVTGKQMDAANKNSAVNQKVQALRDAGYAPEWINQNMPAILGIGEFKKAAAPEEVRRMLHQARLQSDYNYGRQTPQEQQAVIEQDLQLIYGNQGQTKSNPMAGGIGTRQQAGGRKPIVVDMKTGGLSPYTPR